jgi:hypothetical protein
VKTWQRWLCIITFAWLPASVVAAFSHRYLDVWLPGTLVTFLVTSWMLHISFQPERKRQSACPLCGAPPRS